MVHECKNKPVFYDRCENSLNNISVSKGNVIDILFTLNDNQSLLVDISRSSSKTPYIIPHSASLQFMQSHYSILRKLCKEQIVKFRYQ